MMDFLNQTTLQSSPSALFTFSNYKPPMPPSSSSSSFNSTSDHLIPSSTSLSLNSIPSSSNASNRSSCWDKMQPEDDSVIQALKVFTIIIFPIGMVGNILTIIVMRRKPFRASSACVYLPSIAFFDILTLVSGIPNEWTTWYGIQYPTWLCCLHRFLNYSTGDVSVWLLVVFTMDRFIAVCFPFQKKLFCTPRKALITTLICILLAIFKNAHVFWTRGYVESKCKCTKIKQYANFENNVRPYIALITVSLLPFICILIFNGFIIHHLLKSSKSKPKSFSGKRTNTVKNSVSVGESQKIANDSVKKDKKSFYQTTAMCLSVSFAFLILYFPTIVVQICKSTNEFNNDLFEQIRNISNMLPLVNHSINFYLYCLTGIRFRNELKILFRPKKDESYSIFSAFSPRYSSQGASVVMSDLHNTAENKLADAAIALAMGSK